MGWPWRISGEGNGQYQPCPLPVDRALCSPPLTSSPLCARLLSFQSHPQSCCSLCSHTGSKGERVPSGWLFLGPALPQVEKMKSMRLLAGSRILLGSLEAWGLGPQSSGASGGDLENSAMGQPLGERCWICCCHQWPLGTRRRQAGGEGPWSGSY